LHEDIGAAHGQRSAPSCSQAIRDKCFVPGAVGGDEINKGIWPVERTVDSGLAALSDYLQDDGVPQAMSRTTARVPTHSMLASAVRSGIAARSIPAVAPSGWLAASMAVGRPMWPTPLIIDEPTVAAQRTAARGC
jgi:hypothetical protein